VTESPLPSFELVVITGLSGSGMTEATKSFEDMGYLVMDNLPPSVIEQVADLLRGTGMGRAAIVVRPSGREFFSEFFADLGGAFTRLREKGMELRIVFLEASDEALVRRYEEKRRPHPLAPTERVQDGIRRERQLMEALKDDAELVIDTSVLSPHELRERVLGAFLRPSGDAGLQLSVLSFGYKYGIPMDADLVFDMRFLPNPHWVADLRPLDGTDERVREFVLSQEEATSYEKRIEELLESALPGFEREGKHYLTVAVGCTGGRHRSVVMAEEIARFLRDLGHPVAVQHRDLDRE
jgi:RNase adapter protein RapZ